MAYTKQTWSNLPSETTPISAERLNHIENGVEDISEDVQILNTAVESLNKNIATIYSTSNQSSVGNLETIVLNDSIIVGEGLSFNNNGIIIGENISVVKINAQIGIQYSDPNGEYGCSATKNGVVIPQTRCGGYKSGSGVCTSSFSPMIVNVSENDVIKLYKNGNVSNQLRAYECYLTVEVVK